MSEKGKLLKIYIGESAGHHSEPLYHHIVKEIKKLGLSGATTIRGIEGFGANSVIHSTRILRLSEDLPILIEVVDTEENIYKLINLLEDTVTTGILMAVLDAEIIQYTKLQE